MIVGNPRSFDKKFSFQVQIDGFTSFGFSKCSALEFEVAEIKHYEGGTLIANKSAGRLDFKDITLERGATRDLDMYLWAGNVANAPANIGLTEVLYKRHMDIVQLDRDGTLLKRWSIFNAWPKSFTAGEWDNNSDETVIEKMVLCYDFFTRTF